MKLGGEVNYNRHWMIPGKINIIFWQEERLLIVTDCILPILKLKCQKSLKCCCSETGITPFTVSSDILSIFHSYSSVKMKIKMLLNVSLSLFNVNWSLLPNSLNHNFAHLPKLVETSNLQAKQMHRLLPATTIFLKLRNNVENQSHLKLPWWKGGWWRKAHFIL